MISTYGTPSISERHWQPSATLDILRQRTALINQIRHFFAERDVLEVDTPVLSHATVTDPLVTGIPAIFQEIGSTQEKRLYLQTSPEYGMKRLLAAGMGSIFQMSKSFRQGEVGKLHNPEFTMLEWYRLGFDHHALMDEMDVLLQLILQAGPARRMTYAEAYWQYLNLDAHTASEETLAACARQQNIPLSEDLPNRSAWLDLLWTHCIEPFIAEEQPLFLYDFPVFQASLAKIRAGNPPVASRFEVYFKGVELANGFHELQDADEQERRFENDLVVRLESGLSAMPIDKRFLAALQHGFPDCAGVALGLDRLIMLALGCKSIAEVMSFSFVIA